MAGAPPTEAELRNMVQAAPPNIQPVLSRFADYLVRIDAIMAQNAGTMANNLQNLTQNNDDAHTAFNQDLAGLKTRADRLEAQVIALDARADAVAHDGSTAVQRIDALETSVGGLSTRADKVTADGNAAIQRISDLETKVVILEQLTAQTQSASGSQGPQSAAPSLTGAELVQAFKDAVAVAATAAPRSSNGKPLAEASRAQQLKKNKGSPLGDPNFRKWKRTIEQ